MSARTVYATVQKSDGSQIRLGSMLDKSAGMVHVYVVGGGALGLYRIERFEGGKLTATTLRDLFTYKWKGEK